jgi:hypothetical protein
VILFIDRDLGKKLGYALRTVGVSVTNHIERYPTADEESISDAQWIQEASLRKEVIVTRDGGIRRESAELQAMIAAGARCFVLETGNAPAFVYLRALMVAWPQMERVTAEEPPPFMFAITRAGRVLRRFPKVS